MAYFDRFDICEAYAALEIDWNVDGIVWERPHSKRARESIGVQLSRIEFRAGAAFSGFESLSANGRGIYNAACERWRLGDGGYKPCACAECFEIAIGYGRPLCHECAEAGCEGGSCSVERFEECEAEE